MPYNTISFLHQANYSIIDFVCGKMDKCIFKQIHDIQSKTKS